MSYTENAALYISSRKTGTTLPTQEVSEDVNRMITHHQIPTFCMSLSITTRIFSAYINKTLSSPVNHHCLEFDSVIGHGSNKSNGNNVIFNISHDFNFEVIVY